MTHNELLKSGQTALKYASGLLPELTLLVESEPDTVNIRAVMAQVRALHSSADNARVYARVVQLGASRSATLHNARILIDNTARFFEFAVSYTMWVYENHGKSSDLLTFLVEESREFSLPPSDAFTRLFESALLMEGGAYTEAVTLDVINNMTGWTITEALHNIRQA